jgi:hypothetical protein
MSEKVLSKFPVKGVAKPRPLSGLLAKRASFEDMIHHPLVQAIGYLALAGEGIHAMSSKEWLGAKMPKIQSAFHGISGQLDYSQFDLDLVPVEFAGAVERMYEAAPDPDGPEIDAFIDSLPEDLQLFYIFQSLQCNEGWLYKSRAIIGYVTLVDIVRNSENGWAEKNQYHWILEDAYLFKNPIENVRGQLGIFDINIPEEEIKERKTYG